ncbi:uncharacterized protein LOC129586724 [Paramacrobiotus metropolitanus]|uniref:uncharacterized protein LOC129586724 n=1 Tax=Paramacrobiotus metropolitanus TaxID=2943436 RepID=UPI0024465332|nr:uncharacterized protein LOC129586724 [Paramacrobiotus metropolitanus]
MQTVRSTSAKISGFCTILPTKNMSVVFSTRLYTTTKCVATGSHVKPQNPVKKVLKSGVFWDIENIPVKKSIAAKRIPEIKQALTNFITQVNHYDEENPPKKEIEKFLAVARQQGENQFPTTSDLVKRTLVEHEIELLDLPYCNDPDYCDDAIYHSVLYFTRDYDKCVVVALTGDVGLVRRINNINRDFDLIVVMQRAGKKTSTMQKHCDKIKQTNERGRQQAVYFIDEVIRKCIAGCVPLTFSQLLRLNNSRTNVFDEPYLDENHFRLLFSERCEETSDSSTDLEWAPFSANVLEKLRHHFRLMKAAISQCSNRIRKAFCMPEQTSVTVSG